MSGLLLGWLLLGWFLLGWILDGFFLLSCSFLSPESFSLSLLFFESQSFSLGIGSSGFLSSESISFRFFLKSDPLGLSGGLCSSCLLGKSELLCCLFLLSNSLSLFFF